MNFKVGDKVRVRKDLMVDELYESHRFTKEMEKFKGLEFKVISTMKDGYLDNIDIYRLESLHFIFTDEMLESVEEPIKDPSQFTKADLKSKMVVETQNGDLYLVVDDVVIRRDGFLNLDGYNEDLTSNYAFKEYDIMGVYKYKNTIHDNDASGFDTLMNKEKLTLIWQRQELKKITKDELKVMGYELAEEEKIETLDELVKRLGLTPRPIEIGRRYENKNGYSWVYVNERNEYITNFPESRMLSEYPKVYKVRY